MNELYYYTARGRDGRLLRGSIQASSEAVALANLRMRALLVTSLTALTTPRGAVLRAASPGIRTADSAAFFRALATLLHAGVPIRRAIEIAIEQRPNRRLREALLSASQEIQNGTAFSQALASHPREFPAIFVAMIRAGEAAGSLEDVLERIAALLERRDAMHKKIGAALAYPGIVFATAIGLVGFLLLSIVPSFGRMYAQMHVPLPRSTAMLLQAAIVVRSAGFWIAASIVLAAAICAVVVAAHDERLRRTVESACHRLPIAGDLARTVAEARFARVLADLLHAGLPIELSLASAADATASPRYRERVARVRATVARGETLAAALIAERFTPFFVQIVRVGEEAGDLDALLARAASYYEREVESRLDAATAVLEPALVLLLGSIVGGIVTSVFVPLYTLIGSIR